MNIYPTLNLTLALYQAEELFQVSHLRYQEHPVVRRCLSSSAFAPHTSLLFLALVPLILFSSNLQYYLHPSYFKSDC